MVYWLEVHFLTMLLWVCKMILIDRYDSDLAFLSKQRPWISQKFQVSIPLCEGLLKVLLLKRPRLEFSCEKLLRFIESFHHQGLRERPQSGFYHTLLLLSDHDAVCPNPPAVTGAGGQGRGGPGKGERQRKKDKQSVWGRWVQCRNKGMSPLK